MVSNRCVCVKLKEIQSGKHNAHVCFRILALSGVQTAALPHEDVRGVIAHYFRRLVRDVKGAEGIADSKAETVLNAFELTLTIGQLRGIHSHHNWEHLMEGKFAIDV